MAETAQSGAFDGGRGRVHRVDLNHPAEFVGHVGFGVDVETVVFLAPSVPHARHTVAVPRFLFRGTGDVGLAVGIQFVRPEIAVEVLFGHQPCAPRGQPARAVVERADDLGAAGVVVGFQPCVTGGRAAQRHGGFEWGDAAVHLAVAHHLPFARVVAGDLDHRAAVGCHLDVDQLRRHAFEVHLVLTA